MASYTDSSKMKVNHKDLLENALLQYSNSDPDIVVICQDGQPLSTSKFLLAFYSPTIQNIFKSVESHISISLYLPVSSGSVINLLNILATGQAVSKDTHDLIEVNDAAKVLGIPFKGWELGSKPDKSDTNKDVENKIVEKKEEMVKMLETNPAWLKVESEFFSCENEEVVTIDEKHILNTVKSKTPKRKVEKDFDSESIEDDKVKVEYEDNKNKRKKSEIRNSNMCNKCGRTFAKRQVLEKHIEKKVCERKMAQDDKIRQMMKKAIEIVNS